MPLTLFLIYSLIFGLIIGSFLNCLIWRLHSGESMMDRSKCPNCHKMILWYDNIPVLSYLFLMGKCRHCHKHISIQYPIMEIVTGLLFALSFYINFGLDAINGQFFFDVNATIALFRDFYLIAVMIIIFVYDLRWYLILDIITIPAIIILFILNLILGLSLLSLLLAGMIGGGFFLLQFIVSKGKWIGGGDIRLGFLMGIALGWPNIITALMLAYTVGSIISLGLVFFTKKKWDSQVPFGVFLSSAALVTLFWGNDLVQWYLGVIGL